MQNLALIIATLIASTTAFAGSITNGSFESQTIPVGGEQAVSVLPGSSELPGWTVVGSGAGDLLAVMGEAN
jgi:hypothetical protein